MSPITLAPTITVNGQLLATSWQDDLLECKVELELRTTGQVTMRFTRSRLHAGSVGHHEPRDQRDRRGARDGHADTKQR